MALGSPFASSSRSFDMTTPSPLRTPSSPALSERERLNDTPSKRTFPFDQDAPAADHITAENSRNRGDMLAAVPFNRTTPSPFRTPSSPGLSEGEGLEDTPSKCTFLFDQYSPATDRLTAETSRNRGESLATVQSAHTPAAQSNVDVRIKASTDMLIASLEKTFPATSIAVTYVKNLVDLMMRIEQRAGFPSYSVSARSEITDIH
jgi:hypothetical protein